MGNPKYFTSWSLFRINFAQSDECFSKARLPQYFVNMVAAHHSLDKQTRHTSIDILRYSRRHFDSQPAVSHLIIRHLCISVRNLQFNRYLFRQDATIIIFIPPNFYGNRGRMQVIRHSVGTLCTVTIARFL